MMCLFGDLMADHLIYGLVDPRNGELRYVGKTSRRLAVRMWHHACPANNRDTTHRSLWVRGLLREGARPEAFVIESLPTEDECFDAERFWIAYFKGIGARLTNLTDGGEGRSGFKMSRESVERSASKRRGRPMPAEMKARMSAARKGIPSTKRGKPANYSDEALAKMRESGKRCAGNGNPFFGRAHSDEAKARIRQERAKQDMSHLYRAVMDENGNKYASLGEAARALGVSVSTVCSALRGYAGRSNRVRGVSIFYMESA